MQNARSYKSVKFNSLYRKCTLHFLKIKKLKVLSSLLSKEKIVKQRFFIRKLKYIFLIPVSYFSPPIVIVFIWNRHQETGFRSSELAQINQSRESPNDLEPFNCASALGLRSRAHSSHTIHLFTTHLQLLIVPFSDCDRRAIFNGQLVDFFLYYNLIL